MVGAQGQVKLSKVAKKSSAYDITCNPQAKFFFECKLQDLLHLLTLRPGPYPVQDQRYSRAKPHTNQLFFANCLN